MDVFGYCKNIGNTTFSQKEFNEVDAMVLSQLVYYPFDDCFKANNRVNTKELFDCISKDVGIFNSQHKDEYKLLKIMSKGERFRNLIFYNYVSITDNSNTEQFCAMMVKISNNLSAIVFRGTDDSLTGWYEDMQLSYKDVSSQHEALKYVESNCHLFKKYILIGHSKGGNLSLYAAVNSKKSIQNRIQKIYSFDGPGLREGSYSFESFNRIRDKYIKMVPEFDVVGLIYNNGENRIVVKSSNIGILQHSTYSWLIEGDKFVVVGKYDRNTELFDIILSNFLDRTSNEEREGFVEEIFTGLRELGVQSMYDFISFDLPLIVRLLKKIDGFSDKTKKIANIIITEVIETFGNGIRLDIKNTLSAWVRK